MTPEKHPFVLLPDQGKEILVGNSKLLVKLMSQATGNAFTITEYELAPQFPGPPAHKHKVFEHAWYVLEGSLTVQLENELAVLTKGSFVFIPQKTVHAFSNKTDAPVNVLVIDTPGGFEHYYNDLQAAFGEGKAIDQELMREIQLKYDTFPPDFAF